MGKPLVGFKVQFMRCNAANKGRGRSFESQKLNYNGTSMKGLAMMIPSMNFLINLFIVFIQFQQVSYFWKKHSVQKRMLRGVHTSEGFDEKCIILYKL